MSVEGIIGVVTALVALFSAAATSPCWAPLFSSDATRTTELLKGKKEALRLLIKDLKLKKRGESGVFTKQASDLVSESDALLAQLDDAVLAELEGRTNKRCMCGLVPHLCTQKRALSTMETQLIPKLKNLIQKTESVANPCCRGYRRSREVAIDGKKRRDAQEKIWEAVSSAETPRLICIHGALGVGKTAVAKWAHNRALGDDTEELFRYVVWVDVEYGADVRGVQASIAKSLDISLGGSSSSSSSSAVENALLEMDNFLLILDSMWKATSLKEIGIPELVGRRKVMVTSRISTVCDQMEEIAAKFELQPLQSEVEAWEVFKKEMAGTRVSEESVISGVIKRVLTAELDGLPLAITKFALALGNAHGGEEFSSADVHDKFGKKPFYLQGTDHELLNKFSNSYLNLDEKLRACFMYCALFPRGHLISAKELIEYWIWEGLLGNDFDTLDEGAKVGKTALQELQNKHVLQWASCDHEKVKMLSLYRAMAIDTMGKEGRTVCIRSGCHLTSVPPSGRDWNSKVERASFMKNKLTALVLKDNKNCSQLSTLLLQYNPLDYNHLHNEDFFTSMCSLRVLDLSWTKISTLPNSISKLKKLHALLLRSCSNLTIVPDLSKLQQLRVLDVSCTPLLRCPPGIKNLKRLRRLDLSQTTLGSFPDRVVGHLMELEELLMITESNCVWRSAEDGPHGATEACVEDLFKLKKLAVIQLHLCSTLTLNKYLSYVEGYTNLPTRFRFLVGDVHGGRGSYVEENSISISGIDAYKTSLNSKLNMAIMRSLRELNVLDVSNLSGLSSYYLFSVEILGSLTKLRELRVTSCGEMVELVRGATLTLCLPKLTRLLLFDLPTLKSVCCGQVLHCPELRFIEVWECRSLKFPMINPHHTATWGSCPRLKAHVKGERSWWFGELEWDNPGNSNQGFGGSPHSHSNFTFSEANVPPELTPRRTARVKRLLEPQEEKADVEIQTSNEIRLIGTIGFGIAWTQRNLIGLAPTSRLMAGSATTRVERDMPQEQGSSSITDEHQTNATGNRWMDYFSLLSTT